MNETLLRRLSALTEEERRILEGGGLARDAYTDGSAFVVSSRKLLPPRRMITLRPHTRFAAFPAHSHDYVEMLYMLSGQTVHDLPNGETVTLRAGELLLINCQTTHSIRLCGEGDVGVNFIVQPAFFDDALAAVGSSNVLGRFLLDAILRGGDSVPYLHFRVAERPAVQSLLESMLFSLLPESPAGQRILKASMTLLFLYLMDSAAALTMPASRGDALVLAVLDEIQHGYAAISLQDVAARHHISPAYLSQAVKRATGETCTVLLQRRRMAQARKLLRETDLPVAEVCNAVGYTNAGHFYRLFREENGATPDEYRRVNSGRSQV